MARLGLIAVPLAAVAGLFTASPADAALERVVVRQGPLTLNPYEVRFTSRSTRAVRAPGLDGYLVRMHARVVDRAGKPIPVQRAMLHHIVYTNGGPDGRRRDAACPQRSIFERFYGTSEELRPLTLPPGYGYDYTRRDRWRASC